MLDPDKRLLDALARLDPNNDDHWTDNGSPAMKAVGELYGADVTRKAVLQLAPLFNREQALAGARPGTEAEPPVDPKVAAPSDIVPVMASDDPESEQITVVEEAPRPKGLDEDEREAIKAAIAEYDVALQEIEVEVDQINARRDQINKERDELVKKLEAGGDESFATQFQGWIAAQNMERAQRAGHSELASALQKAGIISQSVIDNAFARKTKRGGQRPVHPSLG